MKWIKNKNLLILFPNNSDTQDSPTFDFYSSPSSSSEQTEVRGSPVWPISPGIPRVGEAAVEGQLVAEVHVIAKPVEQVLGLSLLSLRKVLSPPLEECRVWEEFLWGLGLLCLHHVVWHCLWGRVNFIFHPL